MSMLRERGGKVSMTRVASLVCVALAGLLALATSLDDDVDVDSEIILYFLAAGTVPKVFQRFVEGRTGGSTGSGATADPAPPSEP